MTAIHQLIPTFSYGNAIGEATLGMQSLLRRLGFESEIFADLIDRRVHRHARSTEELPTLGAEDGLIYHLSIGANTARVFRASRAKQILVYHNITPPQYYDEINPRVAYWLRQGHIDLSELAPTAALCIADSPFNANELRSYGARRITVLAPHVDLDRLHPRPATPAAPPTILFVGRIAPNKKQEDLIRALAAMQTTSVSNARLVLAGGREDTEGYASSLADLATRLNVNNRVEFSPPGLSDAALTNYYATASVFACASEHEGFCMPLVEAMAFSVPVVAFRAGAVPETVGDAGVIIDTKDPFVWADILQTVICDESLRQILIAAGHARLDAINKDRSSRKLSDALSSIGLTATV